MTPRAWAFALALALTACASGPPPAPAPAPITEALVETVDAGFRAGPDGLVYTAVYDLLIPSDGTLRAVAEFQNPVAGAPPLRTEQAVPAGERRIALESPLLHEIGNHRGYAVVLTLYRGGAPVATRRDTARFDVDEAALPMFIRRGIHVR
jgi:hypothetical protein